MVEEAQLVLYFLSIPAVSAAGLIDSQHCVHIYAPLSSGAIHKTDPRVCIF